MDYLKLNMKKLLFAFIVAQFTFGFSGCSSNYSPVVPPVTQAGSLTTADVNQLVAQAVEQADRLSQKVVVAVSDRSGNILAVYRMNNSSASVWDVNVGAVPKARTAAYLSSNQHAFTTLTACYITRSHFPPATPNTPGGPLYGVPFSSVGGGDIQPNNSQPPGQAATGQMGLSGVPGGVPIFKNGQLVGGLGVSAYPNAANLGNTFLTDCSGAPKLAETIALGAVIGFTPLSDFRGDNIFIDGIRLPYQIENTPAGNFTYTQAIVNSKGNLDQTYPLINVPNFPFSGPVDLGNGQQNFNVRAGQFLTAGEVQNIINQAIATANNTRAAIRRPLNSAARVFIAVADVDGSILGIWRTADATIFSYDVAAQKARTVVAFSDPTTTLGGRFRQVLGLPANQQMAVTTRAIGFLSQRFFPPGQDQPTDGKAVQAGPLFVRGFLALNDYRWQQNLGLAPYGNGITIFPGGIPLYKNGQLVGGIGVSGDGVDQDDYIASGGTRGYEAPTQMRTDQFSYQTIPLPYVKFPRNPNLN